VKPTAGEVRNAFEKFLFLLYGKKKTYGERGKGLARPINTNWKKDRMTKLKGADNRILTDRKSQGE